MVDQCKYELEYDCTFLSFIRSGYGTTHGSYLKSYSTIPFGMTACMKRLVCHSICVILVVLILASTIPSSSNFFIPHLWDNILTCSQKVAKNFFVIQKRKYGAIISLTLIVSFVLKKTGYPTLKITRNLPKMTLNSIPDRNVIW